MGSPARSCLSGTSASRPTIPRPFAPPTSATASNALNSLGERPAVIFANVWDQYLLIFSVYRNLLIFFYVFYNLSIILPGTCLLLKSIFVYRNLHINGIFSSLILYLFLPLSPYSLSFPFILYAFECVALWCIFISYLN